MSILCIFICEKLENIYGLYVTYRFFKWFFGSSNDFFVKYILYFIKLCN